MQDVALESGFKFHKSIRKRRSWRKHDGLRLAIYRPNSAKKLGNTEVLFVLQYVFIMLSKHII